MAFKSTMLFDVLANILQTKSMEIYAKQIADEHFKDAAPFMVRRYLTMSPDPAVRDLVIENYIALERMPPEVLYRWLLKKVPRQRSTFIRYIR